MYHTKRIRFSILPLALCTLVTVAGAQGRGQGQGSDKPKENQGRAEQPATARGADKAKPQQARDDNRGNRDNDDANRGRSASAPNPSARAIARASGNARFKRTWTTSDIRPELRSRLASNRWSERVAAGALAHAFARDINGNALVIAQSGQMMLVKNRKGDVLVQLDDDRARNLGGWKVKPVHDELSEGSPSFCRSGAGHPNWGRQWCIDKGFGLGVDNNLNNVRWGRALDANDVVFAREPTSTTLTRAALEAVLGQRAVDRLAVHAITLGLVDPLVGTWRTDPAGPRVLLVNSGRYPVAEIVDVNGDLRSDRMVVALRPWDI